MKHWSIRSCCLLLVMVLLFHMLPVQSLAAEETDETVTEQELEEAILEETTTEQSPEEVTSEEIIEEIEEKRTAYTKTFQMRGGYYMAAVYPQPVHYEQDGQWKDIDNTLVAQRDNTYANTAGVWDVRFPGHLTSSSRISVTKDTYMLSFAMAGELHQSGSPEVASVQTAAAQSSASEAFTVNQVQVSSAQLQPVNTQQLQDAAQHEAFVAEKLSAGLLYKNVYSNTDIRYDLISNKVKESVILESYNSTLQGYRYTLEVGDLQPRLQEDGSILFYDYKQEQVVMVMEAPFLVDAAMEHSFDVQVQLTGSGSSYTLTYLLPRQWLASSDRQWPVVLDPVISASTNINNIHDCNVTEHGTINHKDGHNRCGYDPDDGIQRCYIMYSNLPTLTPSDMIVNAYIQMYKPEDSSVGSVEVHKVNSTWDVSTLNWNNKPAYNSVIEDYAIVSVKNWYTWTITDIVRDWYTGENTGMMFKASDAIESAKETNYKHFYSSDFGSESNNPKLIIEYRNNNGLESYWDYTATSSSAGTGYVNNYNGNLVWSHPDIGFDGNRMPVSISHVYNMNDQGSNRFGLGYGWRTNYNQLVYQWDKNANYYVWEDGDGTKHYFLHDSGNQYKDEDGLELTLYVGSNSYGSYYIEDKDNNISYFDAYGRLVRIQNYQETVSAITITYHSGNSGSYIQTIRDGAGRLYQFTFSGDTLLQNIRYYGTGNSEISRVSFAYSSNKNLTRIAKPDGSYGDFGYDSTHYLMSVTDADGYQITYDYNTVAYPGYQPYRIIGVNEFSGTTPGGSLDFQYGHNETTITDHRGNTEILQFNDFGNTVSIQDDEGRAQYAQYAANRKDDKGTANQMLLSSKLQNTVANILRGGSFESGNFWTVQPGVTAVRTDEAVYHGSRSLKIVSPAKEYGVYSEMFTVPAYYTVTFSAYVKSDTSYQLMLQREVSTGVYVNHEGDYVTSGGWTRQELSYTNSTSQPVNMWAFLRAGGAGTFYMDCVQVEFAESASRYNLIESGDFSYSGSSSYKWTGSGLTASDQVISDSRTAAYNLDSNIFSITGSPNAEKKLSYTIAHAGASGDSYVLGGWAWTDKAVPTYNFQDSDDPRDFRLTLTFYNSDGSTTAEHADFNPACKSWQYAATAAVADKAYTSITVSIEYNNNANTVWFDGIQLFKEEFGTSYTYDGNGNVISVTDLQKQNTTYEYDANSNITRIAESSGAEMTYQYDSWGNVTVAKSKQGVIYRFEYDTYGNNTVASIATVASSSYAGEEISVWADYSDDGNYLEELLDPLNRTTRYQYNAQTGVLDWVQYPEDLAQEDPNAFWTDYTYDAMNRVTNITAYTDGLDPFVDYSYNNGRLSTIHTVGGTFRFAYGSFGQRSAVSVDGHGNLATYLYTQDQNHYLSSLDYGNGDRVSYTYDDKGRLTSQIYEDGDTVTYIYDNSGSLATVIDSQSGITTKNFYDLTDRLMRYTETASGFSHSVHYTYDAKNNMTQLVEDVNGQKYTTSYTYDADNRVTGISNGTTTESYTYDRYGRVSNENTTDDLNILVKADTYTFQDLRAGEYTSSQVASHNIFTRNTDCTYSYEYDRNGNITKISQTENGTTSVLAQYDYDTLNRLIREDSPAEQVTRTWYYDRNGNITNRYEFDYAPNTATEALGTPKRVYRYGYAASGWQDQLISYAVEENGTTTTLKSYAHDQIGNPTTDGTWSYEWEHGRQLKSMTKTGEAWSFSYNSDGIRTQKTNGTDTYTYIYNGSQLTQMTKGSDTLHFSYDANGIPLTVTHNGTLYYYKTNLQGDVIGLFDSNTSLIVKYTYDAWGKSVAIQANGGLSASTIAALNPLRYRGYVYDTETGLYYVSSRYYDPEIGRWINADSIIGVDDLLGNNLFAYCDNNPVNKVDYSGEDGQTIELGNGWYYRIDPQNTTTGTKRHIHIWNNKKEYIQNDDGSPHDKGRGEKGKIPKWLNNKLVEKEGWNYNGNRKSFFEETSCEYWVEGTQYTFADGTSAFRSYNPYLQTWYSVDSYEGVYFQGNITSSGSNNITRTFYLPINEPVTFPSFSFGFSWGWLPIPLLY